MQGSFDNLRLIRGAGVKCPLLCKEFIVEAYQVFKARARCVCMWWGGHVRVRGHTCSGPGLGVCVWWACACVRVMCLRPGLGVCVFVFVCGGGGMCVCEGIRVQGQG